MSLQDESMVNITENILMLETKASLNESHIVDVNSLVEEYEKLDQNLIENSNEKIQKLCEILEKFKALEAHNSVIEDIISEIENKIYLSKHMLENPSETSEKMAESDELFEGNKNNWTYSTYNKYIDDKEEDDGVPRMSKKFFNKLLCSNYRLYYRTHELNDILYLHFKSFKKIENLETFTNLKVLYLEGNSIKKIEGLNNLKGLTSLYLHENCIEKIENLDGLENLYNLNLSDNCINKIENLSSLKNLSNLLLKRNRIGTNDADDLIGLSELPEKVTVLDISNNRIEVTEIVQDFLTKIKNLRVLYIQGNECVRKISHYRKTLINTLKNLHYLDDKPVFEDERRFAEAFGRGGLDEERRERALYRKEKEEYENKRLKDFQDLIDKWKREKQDENKENIQKSDDIVTALEDNKETEEERKKKREEEKIKLLMKCKEKQIQKNNLDQNNNETCSDKNQSRDKILSISEENIDEDNLSNSPYDTPQEVVKPKTIKPSNDIFDDNELEENDSMPNLENIKFKKQAEFIDYVLEKNQYEEEKQMDDETPNNTKKDNSRDLSNPENDISQPQEKEELVDTTMDHKQEPKIEISEQNFDELD